MHVQLVFEHSELHVWEICVLENDVFYINMRHFSQTT